VNEPLKGFRRKGAKSQRKSEAGKTEKVGLASHFLRFSCMLFFALFASNAVDVFSGHELGTVRTVTSHNHTEK
jgi:hypothetical protein